MVGHHHRILSDPVGDRAVTQPLSPETGDVPPEIRRHTAILQAKQLLGNSHNVNAEHSSALVLQGILTLLIEYFEGQADVSQYESPTEALVNQVNSGVLPLPTWGAQP